MKKLFRTLLITFLLQTNLSPQNENNTGSLGEIIETSQFNGSVNSTNT